MSETNQQSEGFRTLVLLLNSGVLVAVLGGIGHLLVKVGAIHTKVEAMWERFVDGKD